MRIVMSVLVVALLLNVSASSTKPAPEQQGPPREVLLDFHNLTYREMQEVRILFSCMRALCLYDAEKAPVVTASTLMALSYARNLINQHLMAIPPEKQEMKKALEDSLKLIGQLQLAFGELHYIAEHKEKPSP